MSGNMPGKNLTATEVAMKQQFYRYHRSMMFETNVAEWHAMVVAYMDSLINKSLPPKRMGNRHDARAAPKKIKQWREQWPLLKERDARLHARRYRDGNSR